MAPPREVMRGNKEKFYLRKKKEAAAIISRRVALEGASRTRPAPAEHTVRQSAPEGRRVMFQDWKAAGFFCVPTRLLVLTCVITFEMLRILF